MAVGDAYLEKLDALLVELISGWNVYTTVIVTLILIYVAYPWVTWRDPDTHPLLLARQSAVGSVRRKGESAVYRSLEVYGSPLRAGLNVKEANAPKWSPGRNGDLRDIWNQAIKGPLKEDGSQSESTGKLLTILGKEEVHEHSLESVSQEINIVGQHIKEANGSVIAICLSNSPELLSALFAAAFYGFKAVLIPPRIETKALIAHLTLSKPDFLIAEAGTIELEPVSRSCPSLSHVIWVAKFGSRHMDWNEVPEGVGGKLDVSVWHELFDEKKNVVGSELPTPEPDSKLLPIGLFSGEDRNPQLVEYTSENIVSGVASLISALPRQQRFSPTDIILPADSLCNIYPLTLTLAGLYSGSSIALNSVAGESIDMRLAATGVSPTVIITSSASLSKYHEKLISGQKGIVEKLNHTIQSQSLDTGNMPRPTFLSKLASGGTAAVEPAFANLRLICASHETGSATAPISSQALADLRVILGARIVYAISSPGIAGAVAQTNAFDYRRSNGSSHFGSPLSSVEIKVIGPESDMVKENPEGKIFVAGPAVVGGEKTLDVRAKFNDDSTLSLV